MESAFLTVLNMSITAGYVIAAVLLIRLLLIRAPKKYSYLLWSVVGFRLCCPYSFQNLFSIFSLKLFDLKQAQECNANMLQYVPENIAAAESAVVTTGLSPVNALSQDIVLVTTSNEAASFHPMQLVLAACSFLWAAGIGVLLLYSAVSYGKMKYRMRTAVRMKENVFQSDRIRSPFILGFIRPKIYIPFGLEERMQRYVLLHERYHLKRKDHLIKLFGFLLLTLHWFNPLCWLAFHLMGKDMEMSCDEKVLGSEKNIRRVYSTALLSFAVNKRFPAPGPLAFGESSVKGRIKNVLSWKRPKAGMTVFSVLLCSIILVACAANPVGNEQPESGTMDESPSWTDEEEESFASSLAEADETVAGPQEETQYRNGPESFPDKILLIDRGDGAQKLYVGGYASWDLSESSAQKAVRLDLDRDGEPEEISLSAVGDVSAENAMPAEWEGRYYYHGYNLHIDGRTYEQYGDYTERTIFALTLDAQQVLLGIFDEGPSDDPVTRFFRYDAGGLHEAGEVPGDIRTLQIDNDGIIRCPYRVDLIRTAAVWSYWYWNGNQVVMRQDSTYEFVTNENVDSSLTLLEELTLYPERDETVSPVTMFPQRVEEVRTDLGEWIYLRGEDGTEGWLRVVYGCIPSLGDKSSLEVFDGAYFYD